VKKADGSTEVIPALSRRAGTKAVRAAEVAEYDKGRRLANEMWGDPKGR
jgi:hypothetical protein